MSLANTDYFTQAKQANLYENWLFQFYYDAEVNFTPVALRDTTVGGVYYPGLIKGKVSIRTKLDLLHSKASTDNITIAMIDAPYEAVYADISSNYSSEFLFGSTHKYINRTVKIYSQLNSQGTLSKCLQIGNFRVIDISANNGMITLRLTSSRPWDFIEIPNTLSTFKKYFPVAYGDYVPNVSTSSITKLCTSNYMYPASVNEVSGDMMCLVASNITTYAHLHYYEKNMDKFIPLDPTDSASEPYQGGNAVRAETTLKRSFRFKPTGIDATDQFTNTENSIDYVTGESSTGYESTTYATDTITLASVPSTSPSTTENLVVTLPQITGNFTSIKVGVKYSISEYLGDAVSQTSSLVLLDLDGVGTTALTDSVLTAELISQYNSNNGLPGTLTLQFTHSCTYDSSASGDSAYATCTIHDVQIAGTVELDYGVGYEASIKAVNDIKELYSGGDGLPNSWDSSAVTEIHEAHRDMLIRYAGYTTTTPYNWSSNLNIDSIKNWKIRWWALEPTSLTKTLEKLQYEGGFIFKWRADGTGSYWCVKDSYGPGDVSATLGDNDVSKIKVGHTPFSELITKMNISYERHPAEKKYITTTTSSNTSARTDWNIGAKENIKEVKLDAYVSPTIPTAPSASPNDDFYSYYDNLYGDIKLVVECSIVNPLYYNLETGDIVKFSVTDPATALGTAWSGLYFMVVSHKRTPGMITIGCRQV